MSKEEKPLTAQKMKFATLFVRLRDIYKAGERAHLPKNRVVTIFNEPAVQDEIDRQQEAIRLERAKQQVQDENLTNDLLDRELITLIRGKETPVGTKLDGIRLGMVATGRIQAGGAKIMELPPSPAGADNGGVAFYQAFVKRVDTPPEPILPQAAAPEAASAAPVAPPTAAETVKPTVTVEPAVPEKSAAPKKQKPPFSRHDARQQTIKLG